MITIYRSTKSKDDFGLITRTAYIVITDGNNAYFWSVGGLPETGDLQPMLDARETELFNAAQVNGDIFNPLDARWSRYEAKQFLLEFPSASLLIELPKDDLITQIQNRTAVGETLLLLTLAFWARLSYAEIKDD